MKPILTTPRSLAARLTLWCGMSAFLLLLVATGVLYFALSEHLEDEDDQRLENRISQVQAVIKQPMLDFDALQHAVEVEYAVQNLEPILIRVRDADGREIAATTGMAVSIPQGSFDRPEYAKNRDGRPYTLVSPAGSTYRAKSTGVVGGDGRRYTIHMAVDHASEIKVLSRYRQRLWMVLVSGLAVSLIVGYWIARRGLAPLGDMARVVAQIRVSTLHQRISADSFPSELGALGATFNTMLQHLEDAFDRLSRYSADIAHELRTPINNLRGEAEVALSRVRQPAEYRETLGSCLEECVRLSQLIDSLLFLARAENPQTQISREQLTVAHELQTIAEFYSVAAEAAGVTLEMQADPHIVAEVDRPLFQRAVGNLIENALKYSATGGRIRVNATLDASALCVEVSDTGRGIPAEHLPHIFNRFYRVDSARAKGTGGLGLGLAIVKTIAQLHGGTVDIQSQEGKGTTLRIFFPNCAHLSAAPPRHDDAAQSAADQWADVS